MSLYWRIFNFLVRRVIAVGFVVVGFVIGLVNLNSLLPGGTIKVGGSPSSDIVFRLAAVLLPIVVTALGVMLYRVAPFSPSKKMRG
jgi:H+/Cl- antiporter ClcA